MAPPDALAIARTLVRCPSVTPDASTALDAAEALLAGAGFDSGRLVFEESGTEPVDNLFARFGNGSPHFCFAGHLDVVPPGDEAAWTHPPFAAEVHEGVLWGRGAEDMKGAVAAAMAAAIAYLAEVPRLAGSISFLLTGDEEGVAINGTVKVLDWMAEAGHLPDHCLVGEPTCRESIGDAVKVGRRGSLNGTLTVRGTQGHVAYPDDAANPIPPLLRCLQAVSAPLDGGSGPFAPSHLEITTVDVGNPTVNIIPAAASAAFNVRFNDRWTAASLEAWLRARLAEAAVGADWSLETWSNAQPFVTPPGPFVDLVLNAVEAATGRRPELSTAGGTSDARYVARHCPVVELGLVSRSIHQVDEHVPVAELIELTDTYAMVLRRYFERMGD